MYLAFTSSAFKILIFLLCKPTNEWKTNDTKDSMKTAYTSWTMVSVVLRIT